MKRSRLRTLGLSAALVLVGFAATTARASQLGTCTMKCGSQTIVIHDITRSSCCTRGNSCDPVTWAPDDGGIVFVC